VDYSSNGRAAPLSRKKFECELIERSAKEKTIKAKEVLRARMRLVRQAASKILGKRQAQLIAANFSNALEHGLRIDSDSVVSGYWPISGEIDIRNLMDQLIEKSVKICLPVTCGPGAPMIFRSWKTGDKLRLGQYGVQQPEQIKMKLEPDTVIVPLLAFDRFGNRLGYGGGYYDSTISFLRQKREILAIGVAFDCQEVSSVPSNERDERLDWVITEKRVIRIGLDQR